ncbi:hypothetical protein [Sediminibacterium sp.]|jgi:hypothetical protein|uniref:hypothetical protein n=1 Tax=Sediminibacterium sp. TaxID=1917865 RepID=UPI003F6FDF64
MPPLRKPWTKYRITDDNRERTDEVSHAAHILPALRIIRDRKLKTGLVTESVVLKEERILATWFSPNSWFNGSRYGHVCFYYQIENLLKRKHMYWVEDMPYLTTACRLLVTANNYDGLLKRYDPATDDGPFTFEDDKYFWNNKVSLQLMFDSAVSTKRCSKIVLTKHHSRFCCLENTCTEKEKGMAKFKVAQLLLSYVMANDFEFDPNLFSFEAKGMGKTKIKPQAVLEEGVNHILAIGSRVIYQNILAEEDEDTIDLITKAAMIHLANSDTASFKKVISIFDSYKTFENSFLYLVFQRFGLSSIEQFKE